MFMYDCFAMLEATFGSCVQYCALPNSRYKVLISVLIYVWLLHPPLVPADLLTGIPLWFQQFRAMFMKRLYTSIRHPMYIALQNLLPVALSICALLILKLVPTNPSEPDLVLNMANLKSTQAYTADFREGLALQSQSPLDAVC